MNATEPILATPTETAKEKKPRKRLTLEEKIEAAQRRLTAKKTERDQLAKALHSLKASKMNKDRNAERKKRSQRLILMGLKYEKILLDNPIKVVNHAIESTTELKNQLQETLKNTENEKDQKEIKKEIADTEIILARLTEIKAKKETPQQQPEATPTETPHPRPGTPTRTRQRPTEQP